MQHSIVIEDFGIRLRPVCIEDAPFIVWLRNLEHARGYIGDSATDIASQEEWLKFNFQCAGDYYFLIETIRGTPVGTYGIYDVNDCEGECGRWIIRPNIPAAVPSIFLAFEVAFMQLGLKRLRAHTVSTNHRVLSLNRRLGFREMETYPAAQVIEGKPVDLVRFEMRVADWPKARECILPMARMAEKSIQDWEESAAPCAWQWQAGR